MTTAERQVHRFAAFTDPTVLTRSLHCSLHPSVPYFVPSLPLPPSLLPLSVLPFGMVRCDLLRLPVTHQTHFLLTVLPSPFETNQWLVTGTAEGVHLHRITAIVKVHLERRSIRSPPPPSPPTHPPSLPSPPPLPSSADPPSLPRALTCAPTITHKRRRASKDTPKRSSQNGKPCVACHTPHGCASLCLGKCS